MVGLDVTHRALLSRERAEGLRASGRAGTFVADLHRFYSSFHETIYGHTSTPIHDALALAWVIRPSLLTLAPLHAEIDSSTGALPRPHRRRPLAPDGPGAERRRRGGGQRRRVHRLPLREDRRRWGKPHPAFAGALQQRTPGACTETAPGRT